jgi:hypothetical protein
MSSWVKINILGLLELKRYIIIIILIIIIIIRGATTLTNLGPAEQPPLAVFPDCTRRYWVDM